MGPTSAPHEATREIPSPTIRVRIGRVEVRAITPEPTLRLPEDKPEPTLSLDDYLRQK
jgi:hypothetical protein